MAEEIFWFSLILAGYVWLGYPVLLACWRRLRRRPVAKRYFAGAQQPKVSIVIAMHNEAAHAAARIRNCLELDYPREKLQVIVTLDAPSDGTDKVAREFLRDVEVVCSPVREGKSAAINRGVARATGEIILFGDARQRFDRQVARELAANFADPSVGAVSGELRILDHQGHEGAYWRYEKFLRSMESDIHSLAGATGAIYAIRRSVFRPVPAETVLDDVVIPMRGVLRGKRAIFDPAARAFDVASETTDQEFEKKRRTLAGNYQLLIKMPELLAPWRNPIWWQFVSHKLGRLIVPYCLAALIISNVFMFNGIYEVAFAGQILFYAAAAAGAIVSHGIAEAEPGAPPIIAQARWMIAILRKLTFVPYTLVLMNWAPLAGLFYFVQVSMRGSAGIWNAVETSHSANAWHSEGIRSKAA